MAAVTVCAVRGEKRLAELDQLPPTLGRHRHRARSPPRHRDASSDAVKGEHVRVCWPTRKFPGELHRLLRSSVNRRAFPSQATKARPRGESIRETMWTVTTGGVGRRRVTRFERGSITATSFRDCTATMILCGSCGVVLNVSGLTAELHRRYPSSGRGRIQPRLRRSRRTRTRAARPGRRRGHLGSPLPGCVF